jgi:DNA phosphorothioation-dependent restriction protein DptG
MAKSLLQQSDYGIIQTRRGLGSFFELGGGLLPLLLLLTIGHEAQKLQVDVFWERLADYGFSFDAGERDRLLGRLKDMGLYERFSDAGAANYVRNLLTIRDQGRA